MNPPPPPINKPRVALASTGKNAELLSTFAIGSARPKPKVVMRLPQGGDPHASLPDLRPGDRLFVSAELEVTTDCVKQQSDCVKKPYKFAPEVEVALLLAGAPGPAAVRAGRSLPLGPPQRRAVSHDRHHDVFVFDTVDYVVPAAGLPWSGPTSVNCAITSWHRHAKKGNVLIIGQHEPGGAVKGDMSSISVARFRPGTQPVPPAIKQTQRQIASLPVEDGARGVVYSLPLEGLEAGEQLRVRAGVKTSLRPLTYPARVTTEVLLSDDPQSTDPGKEAKRVVPDSPQICRGNGRNCLAADDPMTTTKSGAIRIVKDANVPLHVNVIVTTGDPTEQAGPGDRLNMVDGGFLSVIRYAADRAG